MGPPPSIEADGDEVEMVDPKAAVMKMLRDTKDQQEKNKLQGELSLIEKKKNKESWRRGILERVKKDNVSVEPWGDVNSEVDNEPTVQNQMLNMRPMSQLTAPKRVTKEIGGSEDGEKKDPVWQIQKLVD